MRSARGEMERIRRRETALRRSPRARARRRRPIAVDPKPHDFVETRKGETPGSPASSPRACRPAATGGAREIVAFAKDAAGGRRSSPLSRRSSVDLPAPFGPTTIVTRSARDIERDRVDERAASALIADGRAPTEKRSNAKAPFAAKQKPEKEWRAQSRGQNADRHFGGRDQRARENVGAGDAGRRRRRR